MCFGEQTNTPCKVPSTRCAATGKCTTAFFLGDLERIISIDQLPNDWEIIVHTACIELASAYALTGDPKYLKPLLREFDVELEAYRGVQSKLNVGDADALVATIERRLESIRKGIACCVRSMRDSFKEAHEGGRFDDPAILAEALSLLDGSIPLKEPSACGRPVKEIEDVIQSLKISIAVMAEELSRDRAEQTLSESQRGALKAAVDQCEKQIALIVAAITPPTPSDRTTH